jgi:hypothetical protein
VIGMQVTGVEEMKRDMHVLKFVGATNAVAKGIRAGLKVVERAQIAAAPVGKPGRKNSKGQPIEPGVLKRSIGSRFAKGRVRGHQTAKAGLNVKSRLSKVGLRAYHAHLVALGTNPRWAGIKYKYGKRVRGKPSQYVDQDFSAKAKAGNRIGVKYRGIMPANSFIRTAAASVETQAIAATEAATLRGIEAEVQKLLPKVVPR